MPDRHRGCDGPGSVAYHHPPGLRGRRLAQHAAVTGMDAGSARTRIGRAAALVPTRSRVAVRRSSAAGRRGDAAASGDPYRR